MEYLKKLLVASCLLGFSLNAFAEPALQIDIEGGTYDAVNEDIVTSADSFTTYVYANPDNGDFKASITDTFYLSVAIVSSDGSPILEDPSLDIGNFDVTLNGITTTYTLSSLTHGTPPDGAFADIPTHGIYDTYYLEVAFNFDISKKYTLKDTQVITGDAPLLDAGGTMYAQAFGISKVGLLDGYELHFDAYNAAPTNKTRFFAPPSHDGGTYSIPESTSILLLMVGLLGLVAVKRKI